MALREAVQQQDRRPLAAADGVDPHLGSGTGGHHDVDRRELRPEHPATVAPVSSARGSSVASGIGRPPDHTLSERNINIRYRRIAFFVHSGPRRHGKTEITRIGLTPARSSWYGRH